MSTQKTNPNDELIVTNYKINATKQKEIMSELTTINARTGVTKTCYVVHNYRNYANHWLPNVFSHVQPGDRFIITNMKDKDLKNLDADSAVEFLDKISDSDYPLVMQELQRRFSKTVEITRSKPKRADGAKNNFNDIFSF